MSVPRARTEQKPLKGYMLFASKMRGEIIKKKPSLTFGEVRDSSIAPPQTPIPQAAHVLDTSPCRAKQVGKELGAAWKKLSDAEKAKYK